MADATWREWGVRLGIRDRASVVGLWALGVISCSLAFAGCGTDDEAPAANQSGATVANQSVATVAATSVGIVGVYEAIGFYPACGNETLAHQGVTWYTLMHVGSGITHPVDLRDRIDELFAVEREDSPVVGQHGLVKTVAPGPGDDTGTLVVWADGVARWVSDSRELDVWMIDDPIRYRFAC